MEKLQTEYSRPGDGVEVWTDTKTGRVVKRKVEYPGFTANQYYNTEGMPHSFNDEPATTVTYHDGSKAYDWRFHGFLHRDGGPAHINHHGEQFWHLGGNPGRENDLPTAVYPSGLEVWRNKYYKLFTTPTRPHVAMRNGVPGFLNNLQIEFTDGSVIHLNRAQEFHAESGEPAIVWADGTKEWYEEGCKC
jgi:hypothetical protein